MFLTATMSILGLYNYDPTIFDDLSVPLGVDKETLVDSIILSAANREILYPDPVIMKHAVKLWSSANLLTWEKLLKTTQLEYDPISNYDRTEEWSDTRGGTRDTTRSGKNITNDTGSVISTGSDSVNGSVTRSNKAFNDTALTEAEKDVTSNTVASSATNESVNQNIVDITGSEKVVDNENNTRAGRAFGNIGVTTTQQMIEEERRVVQFNIYDYITKSFCNKFVLGVW